MCKIKARVAKQLRAYRHERVTEGSSVTDKNSVTKTVCLTTLLKYVRS